MLIQAAFVGACFASYALHQAVKALAAAEATRQLNEDRLSGALELLLVSPLKATEIIAGHSFAFGQKCSRPMALLMLTNLCMVFVTLGWGKRLHMDGND